MSSVINSVHLNEIPPSRCVLVLQEVGRRALALGAGAIAALAGRAAGEAQRALDRDTRQQAVDLGHLVDHGVAGIESYCNAQARVFRGERRVAAAGRGKGALLPGGAPGGAGDVAGVTGTARHEAAAGLLRRAQAPALAPDMALLVELPVLLDRLRVVNDKLGAALGRRDSAPTAEEVRAEHERCRALVSQTAAHILEHYAGQPEHHADRDHLLEPILGASAAGNDQQPARSMESAA